MFSFSLLCLTQSSQSQSGNALPVQCIVHGALSTFLPTVLSLLVLARSSAASTASAVASEPSLDDDAAAAAAASYFPQVLHYWMGGSTHAKVVVSCNICKILLLTDWITDRGVHTS